MTLSDREAAAIWRRRFGAARAPSPDVPCGPPGLRSLGPACAPASMPALVSYAGSQGNGQPRTSSTKARGVSRRENAWKCAAGASSRLTPRASRRGGEGLPLPYEPAYLTSGAIFTRTPGIVPLFAWRASARWCKPGPPALTFACGSRALLGDRKPSPTPGRRRRRDSRQAQRRQIRVSRSLEGEGERPARRYGVTPSRRT